MKKESIIVRATLERPVHNVIVEATLDELVQAFSPDEVVRLALTQHHREVREGTRQRMMRGSTMDY